MNEIEKAIAPYVQKLSPKERDLFLKNVLRQTKVDSEAATEKVAKEQDRLGNMSAAELAKKIERLDPVRDRAEFNMVYDAHRAAVIREQQERQEAVQAAIEPERQRISQNIESELQRVNTELNYLCSKPSPDLKRIEKLHKEQRQLIDYQRELQNL